MKEKKEEEEDKKREGKYASISLCFFIVGLISAISGLPFIIVGIIDKNNNFNYKINKYRINNFKKSREICNNPTLKLKRHRNTILSNNNNSNNFNSYANYNSDTGEKTHQRINCNKKFLDKTKSYNNNNISNYFKGKKIKNDKIKKYRIIGGVFLIIISIVFFVFAVIYGKKAKENYNKCKKNNDEIEKKKIEKIEKELKHITNKKKRIKLLNKIYNFKKKKLFCKKSLF